LRLRIKEKQSIKLKRTVDNLIIAAKIRIDISYTIEPKYILNSKNSKWIWFCVRIRPKKLEKVRVINEHSGYDWALEKNNWITDQLSWLVNIALGKIISSRLKINKRECFYVTTTKIRLRKSNHVSCCVYWKKTT